MINIVKSVVSVLLVHISLTSGLMADEDKQGDSVKGAEVYADVCMRCHNLRGPSDLSKRAWKFSMNHMRIRAGLTGEETRDVLAFILKSKTSKDSE